MLHSKGTSHMDDTFTLDVDQAREIKHAAKRNGATNADLKSLSSGDMFAKILPILRGYGEVVVKLLQALGEVAFPGATNFVAKDHFVKDTSDTATVKILDLGSNFTTWFIGKVEAKVAPSTIGYGKLLQWAKGTVILAFLGGETKAETSLAEIFHLMSLQANGGVSVLLTNGLANIFFVRDVSGVLRVVRVLWSGGGWYLGAFEASRASGWGDGVQVFSRKLAA